MHNLQVIIALRSLSKNEFKEFGKFVNSPFFNNRSEVVRFYNAIKKYHPSFDSKHLTEENIFGEIYPKKSNSDVLMRKVFSLTSSLLMDFLTIARYRENKLTYNVNLLEVLREKKMFDLFEKRAKFTEEIINKSKHSFEFYEQQAKYTSTVNGYRLIKNEKEMVNNFQKELDDFLGYFVSAILVNYIRLSEWSRVFNMNVDLKLYDEILNFLDKNKFEEFPLAQIYYNMLLLLNTEDEKYFLELQKRGDTFQNKLTDGDIYNINIVLVQYCSKRVVKGDAEYRKHQFDITRKILEKDLIPEGYIEPYFFTNTVRNASYVNEFDWITDFITQYENRLNPLFREETVNYCYAMAEFGKNNFEESLRRLSKINIDRSNMKLDIRNLTILNYYELDYSEEILAQIDAYKHFLTRDEEITPELKEKNTSFLNLLLRLIKNKQTGKQDELFVFIKELKGYPYFAYKAWLLEKADELIKLVK